MPPTPVRESPREKQAREAREEAARQTELRAREEAARVMPDVFDKPEGDGEPKQDEPKQDEPRDPNTVANPKIDLSRCAVKNDKGTRQCILEPHGEDVPHKFRTGGKRKEYKPITGDFAFDDVPEDEVIGGVRESVLDDYEKQLKTKFEESYAAWEAAGKPAEFNSSPRKRVFFEPDNAETVRYKMDRVGRVLGKRVRVVGPKTHTNGNQFFVYVVTDKGTRGTPGSPGE